MEKISTISNIIRRGKLVRIKEETPEEANLSRWKRIRRHLFGHFKSTHRKTIKAGIIQLTTAINAQSLEVTKGKQLAKNLTFLIGKFGKKDKKFADKLQTKLNAIKEKNKEKTELLASAMDNDNGTLMNQLIRHGAYIYDDTYKGEHLISYVIDNQKTNILNSCVNTPDNCGVTPLIDTCMLPLTHREAKKAPQYAKTLIEKGANVNAATKTGNTPLIMAARNGHTDIVKMLLEKGSQVSATNQSGLTALMAAAHNGHPNIVKTLIENGAQANATNRDGLTALIAAAKKGHIDAVNILLANGAIPSLVSNRGRTALSLAQSRGHKAVVNLLEKEIKTTCLVYQADKLKNLRLAPHLKNTYLRSLDKFQQSRNQGYSTFHHAQTTAWMIVSDLIKALQRAEHPKKDFSKFHFFRDPKLFKGKNRDPLFFIQEIDDRRKKNDHTFQDHLLSVDVNPLNNDQNGESSLHFFRNGSNVHNDAQNVALGLVNSYFGNSLSKNKARKLVSNLFTRYGKSKDSCFYVIGVPEEKIDEIGYAAHPYGVACRHASSQHPGWIGLEAKNTILKSIQQGQFAYRCDTYHLQYRLLTHRLTKENGIRTFRTSTLRKESRQDIKETVRKIAEIFTEAFQLSPKTKETLLNKHSEAIVNKYASLRRDMDSSKELTLEEIIELIRLTDLAKDQKVQGKLLRRHKSTLIDHALKNDDGFIFNKLIQHGAYTYKDKYQDMPVLVYALENGKTDILKHIANTYDKNGNTPLIQIARSGVLLADTRPLLAIKLLDNGAKLDMKDKKYGNTALMFAAQSGHTNIVKMLLHRGAKMNNINNKSHFSALMFAAKSGHTNIVKILLATNKADVNAVSKAGDTALMYAAAQGNIAMVQMLLAAGANVDIVDEKGRTALSVARSKGHNIIAALLQSKKGN